MGRVAFSAAAALQLLAIGVSAWLSTWEIESILLSGPIVSAIGLGTACGWYFRRFLSVAILGLSTSILTVFVFLLIFLNGWSPGDAEQVIPQLLLCYQFAVLPVGLIAIYALIQSAGNPQPHIPRQFQLRSLLLLMGGAALVLLGVRFARSATDEILSLIIVGLTIATALGIVATSVLAVWQSPKGARG